MKHLRLPSPLLRTIAILGTVGILVSMVACGTPAPTTPPATSTVAPPTTTTTPPVPPATTTAPPATTAPATTSAPPVTTQPPAPANPELILSSTTSTRDSGLFDILVPLFEKQTGYKVKPIYNGSGAAMALGAKGEADVLVVHSPSAEVTFMNDGNGVNRQLLMHTDYLIVGPPSDPAGIKGMTSATEAFRKIAAAKATFYSRGDNSGTDVTDKAIWKSAGVTVADGSASNPTWYIEGGAGTGMGTLLSIASEKRAYTLTDRATYLNVMKTLSLDILVEGDNALLNIYHVIQVNPTKFPKVNAVGAKAFSDFLLSAATQDVIAKYGVDKFGRPLFFPDAGKVEPALTVIKGTTIKTYTLDELKALPSTEGSGSTKNKAGTITGPDTYVGVLLTSIIKSAGGMTETQTVKITAADAFNKTFTYQQIYFGGFTVMDRAGNPATAAKQPVMLLVYLKNGSPLDATTGPLQTGIMTSSDQVSDSSLWIKQTVTIEIITP